MQIARGVEIFFSFVFTVISFILGWCFYPAVVMEKYLGGEDSSEPVAILAVGLGGILLILAGMVFFWGVSVQSTDIMLVSAFLCAAYLVAGLFCWLKFWSDWNERLF